MVYGIRFAGTLIFGAIFSSAAFAQTALITYGSAPVTSAAPPEAIPVLGSAGLLILGGLLSLIGARWLKKSKHASRALTITIISAGLMISAGSGGWLVSNAEAVVTTTEYLFSEQSSPVSVTSFPAELVNDLETEATIESIDVSECPTSVSLQGTCEADSVLAANGGSCTLDSVCSSVSAGYSVGSTDAVPAEGIDGTGTLEFRCLEWQGNACIRPQSRVPSSTCPSYIDADVWHDMTHFNSPDQRICPSTCAAVTSSGVVVQCASGAVAATPTANGNYSSGYSGASTGCQSANNSLWRNNYSGQTGGLNIRHSSYGDGQSRLILECDWD